MSLVPAVPMVVLVLMPMPMLIPSFTRARSNNCLLIPQHTGLAWTTVFSEQKGTGNGAQFDNSDIRTLNLVKPPFDVTKGNYRVRMEWGSGDWAEFTVSGFLDLLLCVRGASPRRIQSCRVLNRRSPKIQIFLAAR